MKEIRDILAAAASLSGHPAALATVVKKRGSSYRQPGARMLIHRDGSTVGAISGGCLEHDVIAKARSLMDSGRTELAVFDMMNSDDDLWGYGQGCNGVISVLIEPVGSGGSLDPFHVIADVIERRRRAVLATVFRVDGELKIRIGSRVALSDSGKVVEDVRHPVTVAAMVEECEQAFREGTSRCREIRLTEGVIETFVEVLLPPVLLVIAGAGNDAVPLHRIAGELGWQIWITDHRPALAVKERFPVADRVVSGRVEDVVPALPADRRTAAVIMTHQLEQDLALLSALLQKSLPYVGLLGPAKRGELLLQRLADQGVQLTPAMRERLFSPVGLSLGGESPEEIALAITSEIQAVLNAETPGFMRNKRGPIHDRGAGGPPG